ncbi:response regulator [Neoroseomonas nitratireducens]|uniref:response regulator n=1 Tax=Roseomonas nitratireducens TaxID=2820810 RepID=UPI001FD8604C|nr:response regulator [Neoroseomonas nitratireducens]
MALIVDDAATIRSFHRDTLEKAGMRVEEAMNGLEALERALAAPPNLFLVDVNMPQMDGLSFLRAARAEPALAAIPAIIVTSERAAGDVEGSFAAGANLFLSKPVRPEVLARFASVLAGVPLHGASA